MGLNLLSPSLYKLANNKSQATFNTEETYDLFFIHLNEYINTEFRSPIGDGNTTLFELLRTVCQPLCASESFQNFLSTADKTADFFFRKRYYTYYISPHVVNFDISLSELIQIQSNYSKHSFYHLTKMKEKLKNIFKANGVATYQSEDYNEHLSYFKEAVLDDRLEFNTTNILEVLWKHFLAYWDLINSIESGRIRQEITQFLETHDILELWTLQKPENLTDVEEFYWEIRLIGTCKRKRIENCVPATSKYLIEKVTSPLNRLNKAN